MDSSESFVKIIKSASYQDKVYEVLTPLTNITFFLGAGFSKSWDTSFPTGTELFSFDISKDNDEFYEFVDNIGYGNKTKLTFSSFKDIAYQLSMQKKYSSIRGRYIDLYNLNIVENSINAAITKRFKEISVLNHVTKHSEKLKLTTTPNADQKCIVGFFRWIHDQSTCDTDEIPEGVRPHYITTNYDFLIESILDEILAPDDSHLLYTYRGFTPITTNGVNTPKTVFNHWLVQSLIKINGGFEIFKSDENNLAVDYRSKNEQELKHNAPVLIVPNREQDYTGTYFQTIFPKAIRTLQETDVLVIVGYSLPEEDALLRILLRQFAEENVDGTEKCIFFINPMTEHEQKEKLQSVFPYHHLARHRYNIYTFSGYFTDWVNQVMAKV